MVEQGQCSAVRVRRPAVTAGFGAVAFGLAVSLLAESPARAGEAVPRQVFEQAFAPFEMSAAEAESDAGSALEAQARFDLAPVGPQISSGGADFADSGMASYYGAGFAGRPTASGERFNPAALTAAHRTLPFGTLLRVTNPRNGRSVVVRINDRGPFSRARVIDLSQEAARQIGLVRQGQGQVRLVAVAS